MMQLSGQTFMYVCQHGLGMYMYQHGSGSDWQTACNTGYTYFFFVIFISRPYKPAQDALEFIKTLMQRTTSLK